MNQHTVKFYEGILKEYVMLNLVDRNPESMRAFIMRLIGQNTEDSLVINEAYSNVKKEILG